MISGKCLGSILVILLVALTAQAQESPELRESRELNDKVLSLYAVARYDEALPLAKRALELSEKVLGPTHADLISLLSNLAEVNRAIRKPGDALRILDRALRIAETAYAENDVRTARLLDKFAYAAYEQGDNKKAEIAFTRSLNIRMKLPGLAPEEVANAAFNVAEFFRLRREYVKAEPFYNQTISFREKSPGKGNADLIGALRGQVEVLAALKKTSEAAALQNRIDELNVVQGIVSGGVLNGRAVKLVTPAYPAEARNVHASGTVEVQILIDENGNVIEAKAKSAPHPALAAVAEQAAMRSRFTPTLLMGQPVKVNGILIYRFIAQ